MQQQKNNEAVVNNIGRKIFLGIWLIPTLYFFSLGLIDVLSYAYYNTWSKTKGIITEAYTIEHKVKMPSGISYHYENHLTYVYKVDNETYTGHRFSNQHLIRLDTKKYKTDTEVEVLYNPLKHEKAFLKINIDYDRQLLLIIGGAMLMIYFILRKLFKRKASHLDPNQRHWN